MLSASVNITEKNNMTQTVAAIAAKVTGVSAASTVTLAATLDMPHMFGYTVEQWQIIGIITGIVMGAGGLITTILFHWLNYRLKAKRQIAVED
jgi:hypothetical protein